MDSSKFLIVGANGQLGKALSAQYPDAVTVDYQELDITDTAAVEAFEWKNFTHILNAAAYTNVDGAESAEGRVAAWRINATGVMNLARVTEKYAMTLVHISTDYVFDGTADPHTETEPFSPLSVYGASKAAGDIAASSASKHYILRTSWVIGDGKNFVRTMLGLANKDISPTVVADQIGRLTFTSELVQAIDHLLTNGCDYGTYNLSNSGESASWAQITREIFALVGKQNLTVTDTTTAEYFAGKEGIAPRPLLSTLDLKKIQVTSFASSDWRDDLATYIEGERA